VSAAGSAGPGPSVAPVLRAPTGAPGRRFLCPPSAECRICNARDDRATRPAPAAASFEQLVDNVDRTLRRLLRDLDGIRDAYVMTVIDDVRDQLASDATAVRADLNLPPEGTSF
jgi:hypothetical protein